MVATYGTQIKGMQMDGKHKTRDSQRWKKVQVQDKRSYGEMERPSSYLDETDIGGGISDGKGRGREVRGYDFVVGNSKGEGAGRSDQGHDIDEAKSEGEGRSDQGHDIDVANSKGEGAGRSDQGHDIDAANSEGEGAGRSD